jgi:hypothetical protein
MNEISRIEPNDQQVASAGNQQLTAGSDDAAVLEIIKSAAENPNVSVEKMAGLFELHGKIKAQRAEQQFNEAYHRLQMDLPRIKKDGTVEYKGKEAFKFATWEAIDANIRPLLQREGFHLSFDTAPRQGDGGGIIVTGTLHHVGGHRQTASIPLALDSSGGKNSIQGMGSTFSYGKRYTATALLNIITEGEDDGGQRGGTRYITEAQADEVRALMKQAGRQEGAFLDRLFSGDVRSVEEIEVGALVVVKNTLDGIITQQSKKVQS